MAAVVNLARVRLEQEIKAALARADGTPMRHHVDGCAFWIADIYKAALGKDPVDYLRGQFTTLAGALALIGPKGVSFACMKAARRIGWKRIAPAEALTGDLGIMRTPAGCALLIRYRDVWCGRINLGFTAHPQERVVMAWSVC